MQSVNVTMPENAIEEMKKDLSHGLTLRDVTVKD
jgi:hypothetical protein